MTIAVWNTPPADLLGAGFTSGARADRFEVQRLRVVDCERVLLEGHVDVALLPTLRILEHHDAVDVVPAVALSSWKYPFARVVIDHDLETRLRTVVFDPDFEQERFLAQLILREHYKMEPEFVAMPEADVDALMSSEGDGRLLVGPNVPTMSFDGRVLDLGQEWFELANYPMTWGLFATRKDELDPATIRAIRDGVLASERQKKVWVRAQETSKRLHSFYLNDMRFRLDDLCIAGLTELRQYLFYYDLVDDVRDIPFVFLPDDEGDEGPKPII